MLEQLSMKFDQFYILWQLCLEWIKVLHEQDSELTSMQARLHEMCNSNLDMTEVSLKQSSVEWIMSYPGMIMKICYLFVITREKH